MGVESCAEWFALTLRRIVPPAEAARLLSPHLPPGMRLSLVEFTPPGRRTEQAVAEVFTCHLAGNGADDFLSQRLAAFAALAEAPFTREGKNGPRSMDIRPLLLRWVPTRAGGPRGGVTFTLDWHMGYLSPLVFTLAVLGPDAEAPELRARLRLCKTGQIFADGRTFPPEGTPADR